MSDGGSDGKGSKNDLNQAWVSQTTGSTNDLPFWILKSFRNLNLNLKSEQSWSWRYGIHTSIGFNLEEWFHKWPSYNDWPSKITTLNLRMVTFGIKYTFTDNSLQIRRKALTRIGFHKQCHCQRIRAFHWEHIGQSEVHDLQSFEEIFCSKYTKCSEYLYYVNYIVSYPNSLGSLKVM